MCRVLLSKVLLSLTVCFLFIGLAQVSLAQEVGRFIKYNIHAQSKDAVSLVASYANYTNPGAGHVVIPTGTEINVTKYGRRGFVFTYDGGAKKVTFEFQEKRMGMSVQEYVMLITSEGPVKYNYLSTIDKKGIEDGDAYEGMSRKGVMIALGYPAAHRTQSLDFDTWVYWGNRFRTRSIDFDAQGKVSAVR